MLCGQILIFLQKNLLAYSWLLLQYVHRPWLHTRKKTLTAIPRFFDVCESGTAEAVLFENQSFCILSAYHFRNLSAQMVVHPCDPKYIIDQGPFQKVCLLVFHKWTLYFPNTYTDPEIQALTRLSRERGVRKGCFTSPNVGWIQSENSKLVKSTEFTPSFYFS